MEPWNHCIDKINLKKIAMRNLMYNTGPMEFITHALTNITVPLPQHANSYSVTHSSLCEGLRQANGFQKRKRHKRELIFLNYIFSYVAIREPAILTKLCQQMEDTHQWEQKKKKN